jgi:hypothetical protein
MSLELSPPLHRPLAYTPLPPSLSLRRSYLCVAGSGFTYVSKQRGEEQTAKKAKSFCLFSSGR